MSLLASHLRPLIVSNLREDLNPRIKQAMMELFNAIDQDLDVNNYSIDTDTTSSAVDLAVEKLETVLQAFNIPEEIELIMPAPIPLELEEQEKEKADEEDDNSTKFKGGDESESNDELS